MGKPVARVTSGIYYAELIFLLGLIIDNASEISAWIGQKNNASRSVRVIVSLAIAVAIAVGMGLGIYKNVNKINKTTNKAIETGKVRLALNNWCREHPENLYICESEVINLGFVADEMDGSYVNLYYPGGWPARLPQGKDILAGHGIDSIETAVVEKSNVYLIAFEDTDMT